MELDAKTFAILSVTFGVIAALAWDWISHLLDDMERKDKWWEDIEEDADKPRRRKK